MKRKSGPWKRRRWYFIPIGIGLIALVFNIFFIKAPSMPLQNVINWTVGLGLVGGLFTLGVDWVSTGKYRM